MRCWFHLSRPNQHLCQGKAILWVWKYRSESWTLTLHLHTCFLHAFWSVWCLCLWIWSLGPVVLSGGEPGPFATPLQGLNMVKRALCAGCAGMPVEPSVFIGNKQPKSTEHLSKCLLEYCVHLSPCPVQPPQRGAPEKEWLTLNSSLQARKWLVWWRVICAWKSACSQKHSSTYGSLK